MIKENRFVKRNIELLQAGGVALDEHEPEKIEQFLKDAQQREMERASAVQTNSITASKYFKRGHPATKIYAESKRLAQDLIDKLSRDYGTRQLADHPDSYHLPANYTRLRLSMEQANGFPVKAHETVTASQMNGSTGPWLANAGSANKFVSPKRDYWSHHKSLDEKIRILSSKSAGKAKGANGPPKFNMDLENDKLRFKNPPRIVIHPATES